MDVSKILWAPCAKWPSYTTVNIYFAEFYFAAFYPFFNIDVHPTPIIPLLQSLLGRDYSFLVASKWRRNEDIHAEWNVCGPVGIIGKEDWEGTCKNPVLISAPEKKNDLDIFETHVNSNKYQKRKMDQKMSESISEWSCYWRIENHNHAIKKRNAVLQQNIVQIN